MWWLDPSTLAVALLLALGIAFTHVANIRRLVRGEEKQVVRPVRWGRRAESPSPELLLEQGPGGTLEAPDPWRRRAADPLVEDEEWVES